MIGLPVKNIFDLKCLQYEISPLKNIYGTNYLLLTISLMEMIINGNREKYIILYKLVSVTLWLVIIACGIIF